MGIQYPDIQPFYKNVFNETINDKSIIRELEFVRCFLEEWTGNFLHPLGNDIFRSGKQNSLLYCYMASQSLTFDWLSHTLLFANYLTVLRELRTILENLFFMYQLDTTFINKTIDEKIEIIEQLEHDGKEPHGKPVFEKSGYANWLPSYELYKDLCRYTHIHTSTSVKLALEIAKSGLPEALDIKYDRHSFVQCSNIWKKIAGVSVALTSDLGNKLGIKFKDLNLSHFDKIW